MATPAPNPPQDLANFAGQTRDLFDQFYLWLRQDSLQALIGIGIAIGLFLLLEAVRHFGCRIIGEHEGWRSVAYRLIKKTNRFFIAAISADLVANLIVPPGALNTAIDFIFTVAAVIQGAIWIREVLMGFVQHRAAASDPADHAQFHTAMGMIRLLINFIVWALALILILDNLGVNVTALVAGLGVGGIAIGLAAQGIFADLFAALAILFDRPFRLGDTIRWGTITGKVEAIGLKTTRVRAVTGEQVIVSNKRLLDQDISNLRRIDERRVTFVLPLSPKCSSEKLEAVAGLVKGVVEAQKNTRFEHAHFLEVTPTGINMEIQFYMTVPQADAMSATRHKVIAGIKGALDAQHIWLADTTPPLPE